jgi:flavin-dependent dehydrogenase
MHGGEGDDGSILATVTLGAAVSSRWDLVVIGAGPAGAIAALHAARQGATVLLIDKARFPRDKPCGCCVGARAIALLRGAGVEPAMDNAGAGHVRRLLLGAGGDRASIPVRPMRVLSRRALDAMLVRAALRAGASFLPQARATVGPAESGTRAVSVAGAAGEAAIDARAVIVADGLAGGALGRDALPVASVRPGARIGVAAIVDGHPAPRAGEIEMACGAGGYIGAVRLEDGRVGVAAALDPMIVRRAGGAAACAAIRASAGFAPIDGLAAARWLGTPGLTRARSAVAGERIFVAGDAACFVEPFTGEGLGWALASGAAAAAIALRAARADESGVRLAAREWSRAHRRIVARRQIMCRVLAEMLRRPRLAAAGVAVLAALFPGEPAAAAPLDGRRASA